MSAVSNVYPPPIEARRLGWVEHRARPCPHPDRGEAHVNDERARRDASSRVSAVQSVRQSPTPVSFDSISARRGSPLSYAELERRQWQPVRSRPQDSAYIAAHADVVSEYDAARIFLERPEDPVSMHGLRLAEALGREYNISTDEVRSIWANKAVFAGRPAGYKLSQWQTDAFPPFFPDPAYPELDVPRDQKVALGPPPSYRAVNDTPFELWGPRSTTKYMLLDDAPARLVGAEVLEGPPLAHGPKMPGHKRHQRFDAQVKTISCDRAERPPEGHVDITIIECLNLKVPHGFQNIWNISSISPFVQVEIVERGANGAEAIQYLKTTTMSRSKMDTFKRSPIDSVFNETCRFHVPHLNQSEVAAVSRSNVLVSVIDSQSSKCLGSVTIPASEILRKRAAPFYTWYELMKPAPDGHLVPVTGSEPTKLSCIQLGFWSNPLAESKARYLINDDREHALAHENLLLADRQAALDHEEDRLRAIRIAQDHRTREMEKQRSRLAQKGGETLEAPSSASTFTMPNLPAFSMPEMPALSMPSLPTFSMPSFSAAAQQAEDAGPQADQVEEVVAPAESRSAVPQVIPVVPVSSMEPSVPLVHIEGTDGLLPEQVIAPEAPPEAARALESMSQNPERLAKEYEEALRPWMAVKDVTDLLVNQKINDGTRRRWTLDVVPGVLGLLQGISAAGYEIMLTSKAEAPQATVVLKALRNLGLVGGIIKEENVMFARTYEHKVTLVQSVGGFTHLIDDDWYILKRSAALSNGVHIILFNPDPETEEEFLRDEAAWLLYRKSLILKMQEMGETQAAIVSEGGSKPQSARLQELTARLRGAEEECARKLLHLYDMEPNRVTCVALDTLATTRQSRLYPAAAAVRPWLSVAKSLGVEDSNRFLATLDASDESTPRSKAAGELLAYALHRGRVEGQEAPGRALPPGSVAEADVFIDQGFGAQPNRDDAMGMLADALVGAAEGGEVADGGGLGPFFPLDAGAMASEAAKRRHQAWQSGLCKAYDHMGFGIDFFAPPVDKSQTFLDSGRRPLQALEVCRVMPSGPAARSGLIEKGMLLISVDGVRLDLAGAPDGREVLGARISTYRQSADGKNSARQQSFRTLQWSQLAKTTFQGAQARELADAGLFLDGDGSVKCQCCHVPVHGISKGEKLASVLHRDLPGSCPLTAATHLSSLEGSRGAARIEPRAADMPPEYLSCGVILGFLTPPRGPGETVIVTEKGLDDEDLKRVVYVWLRPEPVAPMLAPAARGRVLIDIDRVILRLRHFEIVNEQAEEVGNGSSDRYRDPWSGGLLHSPTSAYTWRDLEEVLDSQGRLIFVDHGAKTTALEPPALLHPRPLPPGWQAKIDDDGRMFYRHEEQDVSQWNFPLE